MMVRRELGLVLAAAMATVAGCAPMTTTPAKPTGAAAPPSSAATAATSAETTRAVTPTGTAIDTTTPSPQAQSVLSRIPEPLTPAEQALSPVRDTARTHITVVAPAATYDSLQAAPIPSATQPLGSETSTVTRGEPVASTTSATTPAGVAAAGGAATSGAAAGAAAAGGAAATGSTAAGSASGAAATGAAASGSSASGPCWRLQVAAPLESEKEKADGRVEAAQSLLMVPFTIVPEKGYLKVRTSDCMSREAADALKKRAIESGFDGSFLVDTNAPPPPPHKQARVPASKHKK